MSNHSIVDSNNLKFHKIMIPVIQSTITHKTLRFLFINSFFSQENDPLFDSDLFNRTKRIQSI